MNTVQVVYWVVGIVLAFLTGSGVVLAWYKFFVIERKGPRFAVTSDVERVRIPARVRETILNGEMSSRELGDIPAGLALQKQFSEASRFCTGLESVVTLSIKNVGDRPAEQTALQTDEKGLAEIRRGAAIDIVQFSGKLPLGSFDQQETVEATLWIESAEARRYMHIIHSLDKQVIQINKGPLYDWRIFAALLGLVTIISGLSRLTDRVAGLQNYHLNFVGSLSMILMVVCGVVAGIVAGLGIERARR